MKRLYGMIKTKNMTKKQFKEELNRVFDDNLHPKQWHNILDYVIIGFIVLSTIEVFLTTFDAVTAKYEPVLKVVDWITQIFFTIEVTLRIWNADMLDPKYKGFWGRVRYCFSFYGLIDFLSTYPFYLSFFMPVPYMVLKGLRVARLFRVFRYMHSFKLLANAIRSKKSELLVSMQFLVIVTLILSFILFFVEHDAQPEAYNNGWYSVVWAFAQYVGDPGGFGEYPPITTTGQIIAFIVGILGIAMFAVPAGLIGSGFTEVMEEEQNEKKIQDNISRIVHSFKFEKEQQYTNFFHVPPYKSLNSILTRKFIPENDIIEAIENSDCLHLYNLADSFNKQDNPADKIVVVNYLKNRPYGCCIDRNSKVTIICTSGPSEPISSWYAYHIAKIGGFNFVSKEIEVDPDNPVTYYNIAKKDSCPNMQLFLDDIDSLSRGDDSWAIVMVASVGPMSRPHQLHFCYSSTKHDTAYDDPHIRIRNTELFEQLYQDMSREMEEKLEYHCDKNEYYTLNSKTNLVHFIKQPNAFALRFESKVNILDSKKMYSAKTIADVINRNIESSVEKSVPPEMLARPAGGHDFGMDDYVN